MSEIIRAVREVLTMEKQQMMNSNEILKKLQKGVYAHKINKQELKGVLDYYKKLQVVYVDNEENVLFLWGLIINIKIKQILI